jgi:hypothetical protein
MCRKGNENSWRLQYRAEVDHVQDILILLKMNIDVGDMLMDYR